MTVTIIIDGAVSEREPFALEMPVVPCVGDEVTIETEEGQEDYKVSAREFRITDSALTTITIWIKYL